MGGYGVIIAAKDVIQLKIQRPINSNPFGGVKSNLISREIVLTGANLGRNSGSNVLVQRRWDLFVNSRWPHLLFNI